MKEFINNLLLFTSLSNMAEGGPCPPPLSPPPSVRLLLDGDEVLLLMSGEKQLVAPPESLSLVEEAAPTMCSEACPFISMTMCMSSSLAMNWRLQNGKLISVLKRRDTVPYRSSGDNSYHW